MKPQRISSELLEVKKAQDIIFSNFSKLDSTEVSLIDAKNFVLSKDILAPFDLHEKDNYAILELKKGSTKEDVEKVAKNEKKVQKHIQEKNIKRLIFVPEKIINIVI